MSPLSSVGMMGALDYYDKLYPVVRMHATLVRVDENSALIHLSGEKLRNCTFMVLDSYYKSTNGLLIDANEIRVDGPPMDGSTRPLGKFDLGTWKIYPTHNATKILIYSEHTCGDRIVITKLADVDIPHE